ncbi:hypothetical protein DFJ73DRAFT_765345 [Zopfochytrium polystomum]|nr:hypothetical protein DFJ73DRAFT_765345 [Zopfochytrium polystomum]
MENIPLIQTVSQSGYIPATSTAYIPVSRPSSALFPSNRQRRDHPASTSNAPHGANLAVPGAPSAAAGPATKEQLHQQQLDLQKARDEAVLRDQLARSAAALVVQCAYRGWTTRRKPGQTVRSGETGRASSAARARLVVAAADPRGKTAAAAAAASDGAAAAGGAASAVRLAASMPSERMIQKFRRFCERVPWVDGQAPTFPHFCAVKIQSIMRMFMVRVPYVRVLEIVRKEQLRKERAKLGDYDGDGRDGGGAALMIQKAWRSYYSVKIFRFYRDLIRFRERGDPGKLLKFVNPNEAKLIDSASGIHVRFRLGGVIGSQQLSILPLTPLMQTTFPPTIYYKIFIHQNLVDMNAFSPRDYTQESAKAPPPRILFSKIGGWYQRRENNGWRPVANRPARDGAFIFDEVTYSTTKPIPFHHAKLRRRDEVQKLRKIAAAGVATKNGKDAAERNNGHADFHGGSEKDSASVPTNPAATVATPQPSEQSDPHPSKRDPAVPPHGLPLGRSQRPPPPEDEENALLLAISELESSLDHDFLVKWTMALDFDEYADNWVSLSTTGRSNDPETFNIFLDEELNRARGFHEQALKNGAVQLQAEAPVGGANAAANGGIELCEKGLEVPAKAQRPWSGRSARSVTDLYLTNRREEAF